MVGYGTRTGRGPDFSVGCGSSAGNNSGPKWGIFSDTPTPTARTHEAPIPSAARTRLHPLRPRFRGSLAAYTTLLAASFQVADSFFSKQAFCPPVQNPSPHPVDGRRHRKKAIEKTEENPRPSLLSHAQPDVTTPGLVHHHRKYTDEICPANATRRGEKKHYSIGIITSSPKRQLTPACESSPITPLWLD